MKLILLALLLGFSLSYDASAAIKYARTYCKNYNSAYNNYRNSGGDCANFVSQCLIKGGQSLDGCAGRDGKGTLPLVSNLRSCLEKKGWHYTQGVSKKFKAGYPFFIGNSHAMIATGVSGNRVTYCGHTNDRCDYSLTDSSYYYYYL